LDSVQAKLSPLNPAAGPHPTYGAPTMDDLPHISMHLSVKTTSPSRYESSSLQHRQMAISFRAPSETKQKLISGLDNNNAASIIANCSSCPPRITGR